MAEPLSTEQVLLLNNLMYMQNKEPFQEISGQSGKTVGEIINAINTDSIADTYDYGSMITGKEWKEMINAISQDDRLMNMTVESTNVDMSDGGGGGTSALFTDGNNEAVVVYRGTASGEWKDNFLGGTATNTADGVSTQQQLNALKWYESLDLDGYETVTVTGHSKGGNKAKYITLMNEEDNVDRCLSFDGQGFSDEFIDKYSDQISIRQDRIHNHIVEEDYVNLLLNDVGDSTFYKAYNIGQKGVLENHCPNTFFRVNPDGSLSMTEGSRSSTMAAVDEFLNGYLRSLSPEEKAGTLLLFGEIAEMYLGHPNNPPGIQNLIDLILEGDNVEYIGKLLAYLRVYEQQNPEFMKEIQKLLKDYGMQDISDMLDTVDEILESKYSDLLIDAADGAASHLPAFVINFILDKIREKSEIDLSEEEARKLLSVISVMNNEIDHVTIYDGSDISVASAANFVVELDKLRYVSSEFSGFSRELQGCASSLESAMSMLTGSYMVFIKPVLRRHKNNLEKYATLCRRIHEKTDEICGQYVRTENTNTGKFH